VAIYWHCTVEFTDQLEPSSSFWKFRHQRILKGKELGMDWSLL
jgi:hypothetical protein